MRLRRVFAGLSLASCLLLASEATAVPTVSNSHDNNVTTADITLAVATVTDLLAPAAPAAADADSAAETSAVDIRHNGKVMFKAPQGGNVTIILPHAEAMSAGVPVNGSVAFAGTNGSANYAIPTVDGGAQIAMVIANRAAPTQYTFGVQSGYVASLPGGSLMLQDANRKPFKVIPAAWAYDAKRRPVQTRFVASADGTSFTQLVEHRTDGVVYPVVADPRWIERHWSGTIIHFTNAETRQLGSSTQLAAILLGKNWVLAMMMSSISWWLNEVANRGRCVAVHMSFGWAWEERC